LLRPLAPAAQAAAIQAPATPAAEAAPAPLPNVLCGRPPILFDEDRQRSTTFRREFNIFLNLINKNNKVFHTLYLCVNLALSMIRGHNVDKGKASALPAKSRCSPTIISCINSCQLKSEVVILVDLYSIISISKQ
jgi:hypothetical protein